MDFGEVLGVARHTGGVKLWMVKTVVPTKGELSSSTAAVRSSEGEGVLNSDGVTMPDRAESRDPGLLPTAVISLQVGRQEALVPTQLEPQDRIQSQEIM